MTTQGMVGYWQFEGNAEDGSGYNHKGTLHGGAVYSPGQVGQSLDLKGGNGYVTVTDDDGRLTISAALTIEAWINGNNFGNPGNDSYYIYDKPDSHTLSVEKGKIAVKGTGGMWTPLGTRVKTQRWYHVAWTYDGSYQRIYIDGQEKAGAPAAGVFPSGGKVSISHPLHPFAGLIDEVKVYNRALSSAEIRSSYYEGWTLAGYWPLDGNGKDYSGFSHDGIIYGKANYVGTLVGLGLEFPGNAFVLLKNDDGGLALSEELTMAAWIRADTLDGSGCIYENPGSHSLGIYNGKLAMACAGGFWKPGSTGLEIGKWYYVVGTYDGNFKKIYINGKEAAREAQTGNMPPGLHPRIGHDSHGFHGLADEVKVYRKALPAEVIRQNYLDVPLPVGIWSFDNNTQDKSGWGHFGKKINGPRYMQGIVNQCLYFDGNNDYVLVNNRTHLLDLSMKLTIEAWIMGYVFKNDYHHIYDKYRTVALSVKNGVLALAGRGGWWRPPSTILKTKKWYHVVGIYNGGERRLYINGSLKETQAVDILPMQGDAVYISSPYFTFNGLIDEVKIYNSALSARDVLIRYQAVAANIPDFHH